MILMRVRLRVRVARMAQIPNGAGVAAIDVTRFHPDTKATPPAICIGSTQHQKSISWRTRTVRARPGFSHRRVAEESPPLDVVVVMCSSPRTQSQCAYVCVCVCVRVCVCVCVRACARLGVSVEDACS